MPIAAAMPMVWPEGVFDGTRLPEDLQASTWVAIKVQPRCEKAVARRLMQTADAYFLCMRTSVRMYQRRKVTTQIPLFPGYVFVAAGEEQLTTLWQDRQISCTLRPESQEQFLNELRSLHRLISCGVPLTPEEQLQPGQMARITRGCLSGLIGTVVSNRGGVKLIVSVSLLGQGASVEVTPDMLERI